MKRMIMAVAAALMICSAATAQDDNKTEKKDRKMDQTEMIKRRTNDIVDKYKLDSDQAKKLLELNTKYADTMRPPMGRGGFRGANGRGPRNNNGQRPEMTDEQKTKMEESRKKREESMAAYDNELKTILTNDQYTSYKADMQKRMQNRPQRKESKESKE